MCATIKKYIPGEVVMFSAPFLRSIVDHSAATANRRFEVSKVEKVGKNWLVHMVDMATNTATKALASNLQPATTRR